MRKVQGLPGSVILMRRRAGIDQRHLGLLDDRHDGERRVRAFLADDDVGLVLVEQALGGLRGRQRRAGGIFILDGELVAVDAGLVELLERKLDALLVLRAEIGARSRHRQQRADLDRLVLRVRRADGGNRNERRRGRQYVTSLLAHGVLPAGFP